MWKYDLDIIRIAFNVGKSDCNWNSNRDNSFVFKISCIYNKKERKDIIGWFSKNKPWKYDDITRKDG